MDSSDGFVELFADLATREGFRSMRRLVDVDHRSSPSVDAKDTSAERPKSLPRIKVSAQRITPLDRARMIAEEAYARAGEPDCCDPRDLAEGLGVQPNPARCKLPFIRNGVLYYPEHLEVRQRNLGLYYELAVMVSPCDIVPVMDELILPTRTAKRLTVPELERAQPHVPHSRVLTIYMRHGQRSGQWPALR